MKPECVEHHSIAISLITTQLQGDRDAYETLLALDLGAEGWKHVAAVLADGMGLALMRSLGPVGALLVLEAERKDLYLGPDGPPESE